ncbi:MAG: efflux RND transporter periplasmic adaptor subunit [Rhodothermales bacterium]|nr:efflux RND transporter periplasmic adaptor subunit [Rhodothermales bacterium]
MSKPVRRILLGLLFLVIILALAWPKIRQTPSTAASGAPAPAGERPLEVQGLVIVSERLSDRIFTTGTIRANEEIEVHSEISGKITSIHFQEGSAMRLGDLLVKINDSELQAQFRKAEYRVTLASEREIRQKQLYEKGGISLEEYESTLNELNVLKADVELIQAQIAKSEIRAPFDGIVGLRRVSDGSYISPATVITTLQDVDPVKIDFSIPERYAQRVAVGDGIEFSVEGIAESLRGAVYALEPRIDANTRTLLLRARSPNPGRRLLPGAFADIVLVFDEIPDALAVPAIAIIPELGGKKVYVVENGKAVSRMVETGIRTEDRVQILSGLATNDTLLVSGVQLLRPGLSVRVQVLPP